MNKEQALNKIRSHKKAFESMGIHKMYLYGSIARDEARVDSDIDLFYEYEGNDFSLFDQMDAKKLLEDDLACRVDLVSYKALHPAMKEEIERTAISVFDD